MGEPDPPGEAVDRQSIGADQLRERPVDHTFQSLELKSPVLAVAEPEAIPGVDVTRCVYVGDTESVAPDTHGGLYPGDGQVTGGKRKPLPKDESKH